LRAAADFRTTRLGRKTTHLLLRALEAVRVAPKGSLEVASMLERAADGLVAGGKEVGGPSRAGRGGVVGVRVGRAALLGARRCWRARRGVAGVSELPIPQPSQGLFTPLYFFLVRKPSC
jgi:hypothetical protein